MSRYKISLLLFLFAPFLLFGIYLGYLHVTGNFHEIVIGKLYRSAQLKPNDITIYKRKYGIKTIINLRGINKGEAWYDAEVAASIANHIVHVDILMSPERPLNKQETLELINIMRDAPKPILIHCASGTNRTSLASALYLFAIERTSNAKAKTQLSLLYGHFPLPFLRSYAMDKTFKNWQERKNQP